MVGRAWRRSVDCVSHDWAVSRYGILNLLLGRYYRNVCDPDVYALVENEVVARLVSCNVETYVRRFQLVGFDDSMVGKERGSLAKGRFDPASITGPISPLKVNTAA